MSIPASTLFMATDTAIVSANVTSSTSTAVFTTLTDLSFSLTSGMEYEFKYLLAFRVGTTNSGIVVSLTFGSMSVFSAVATAPFTSDGTSGEIQGQITASGGTAFTGWISSSLTTLTSYLAVISGSMTTSADGTIVPSFSTGRDSQTATVMANSIGILNRIN